VYVQVINGTKNVSTFGTGDCGEKKRFICEGYDTGTKGQNMAQECMLMWDVSESKIGKYFA
jgi:hypothetical protein